MSLSPVFIENGPYINGEIIINSVYMYLVNAGGKLTKYLYALLKIVSLIYCMVSEINI